MTVRALLAGNRKLGRTEQGPWLCMYTHTVPPVTIVEANDLTEEGEALLDRSIDTWYLDFDQQDVDVVQIWVTLLDD